MKLPIHYDTSDWRVRRDARKAYTKIQGNRCYHCHKSLSGPPPKEVLALKLNMRLFPFGFLDYPVHLHHDHRTGMTIGSVHSYCNGVLWQYHRE